MKRINNIIKNYLLKLLSKKIDELDYEIKRLKHNYYLQEYKFYKTIKSIEKNEKISIHELMGYSKDNPFFKNYEN